MIICALLYDSMHVGAQSRFLNVLIFTSFVLLVGFTDGNGLDWYGSDNLEGYSEIDYRSLGFSELTRFEPGFVLLNIILGNFRFFLIVMSIVCYYMVWYTIRHMCKYKYIALFVYLASMTLYCYMGVYRHAIAQTIIIYSWNYIDNRKKMLGILILACLFHYSAFISLLYLLIPKTSFISIKKFTFIAVGSFLIRPLIIPAIILLALIMPGETSGKIDLYMNGDDFGTGVSSMLLFSKFALFFFASKYLNRNNVYHCYLFNVYAVSLLLYMTICFSPSFARMVLFFSCSEILLVSFIYQNIKEKHLILKNIQAANSSFKSYNSISIIYLLCILFLYIYTFVNTLLKFNMIYIPYKSILI